MNLLKSFGKFFVIFIDDEECIERRKRKACCCNTMQQKNDFEPDENDSFEDEMLFNSDEFYD